MTDATEDNLSQFELAVEAVQRAERGLHGLPQSAEVRRLHRQLLALKTVLLRDVPPLTAEQRESLAHDAMGLVVEVMDCRSGTSG